MLLSRLEKMLQLFMATTERLTSEQVALKLQVTSRTVRNDIKQLNDELGQFGAEIDAVRGLGYKLVIHNEAQFQQFYQLSEMTMPEGRNERIDAVLRALMRGPQPIDIDELADSLYVSRSTLLGDLKEVRQRLEMYGIDLIQRGVIQWNAPELHIRFFIASYLTNHDRIDARFDQELYPLFTEEAVKTVRHIVETVWSRHERLISDFDVRNLLVHLLIVKQRIAHNHQLVVELDEEGIERSLAAQLIAEMTAHWSLATTESDVDYIALYLLGTHLFSRTTIGDATKRLAQAIVATIDAQLQLSLTGDEQLQEALQHHLQPALYRYRYKMNYRISMAESIKQQFPLAFEAGVIASTSIKRELGWTIDESEISCLALHIGVALERQKLLAKPKRCYVVCASGLVSAQLLQYQLQSTFQQKLQIVATLPYFQLDAAQLLPVDFIVSTVPLDKPLGAPVIHVQSLLTADDKAKITTYLEQRDVTPSYLQPQWTFLQQSFTTKEEVLRFLTSKVSDDLYDQVMEREQLMPTSFANGMAIPHPMAPFTDETMWLFCTLTKPVQWTNEHRVQVVCLLLMEKESVQDWQAMYAQLMQLVEDDTLINQVAKCETFEQLTQLLRKG